MSYSVAVSARNQKLKLEMFELLKRVYRPWPEVMLAMMNLEEDEEEEYEYYPEFDGPFVDEDLHSSSSKCSIGFNYEFSSGAEREYHLALMRWVALRIGRRQTKFRADGIELAQSVPYLVYNGSETVPILVEDEWPQVGKDFEIFWTDSLGMSLGEHRMRELAWYCLPPEVFQKVSLIYHGYSPEIMTEALIEEGLGGAQHLLYVIRNQIARLDMIWKDVQSRAKKA